MAIRARPPVHMAVLYLPNEDAGTGRNGCISLRAMLSMERPVTRNEQLSPC